jgi:hypothetical protein
VSQINSSATMFVQKGYEKDIEEGYAGVKKWKKIKLRKK